MAINYKKHGGESFPDTAGVLDIERGQLASLRPLFWQNDTSVSKTSWGYVTNHEYKTVDSIVDDLVDIVSKNGSLLLNIGPRPDGTIPEPEEKMLREIGRWLAVNGEAIYGTRPFAVFGEGPTAVVEGPFGDTKRQSRSRRRTCASRRGTESSTRSSWTGRPTAACRSGPSLARRPTAAGRWPPWSSWVGRHRSGGPTTRRACTSSCPRRRPPTTPSPCALRGGERHLRRCAGRPLRRHQNRMTRPPANSNWFEYWGSPTT